MDEIIAIITQYFLLPALICVSGTVLVIVRSYIDKISKSLIAKNETETLGIITSMKVNFLSQVDMVVEAAVGANMSLAQELKSQNRKLTLEEISQLNNNAKAIVLNSLPEAVSDGTLLKVLGGQTALESIVDGLIEKHVIDYKIKSGKQLF